MSSSRVRVLAESGLSIALCVVLGLLSIWQMPQGGSVSLVMLPLFVLSLRRGLLVGAAAGSLYGVVDFMLKPYFVHPVQLLLDYPVAFAACGLAGLLATSWRQSAGSGRIAEGLWRAVLPGIALGSMARYVAHVLSGLVFFSSYAVEAGQAPLIYSAAYNSFVLVSAVACAALASAVLPALIRAEGGVPR